VCWTRGTLLSNALPQKWPSSREVQFPEDARSGSIAQARILAGRDYSGTRRTRLLMSSLSPEQARVVAALAPKV